MFEICANCGRNIYDGKSCVDKDGFVVFHITIAKENTEIYFNPTMKLVGPDGVPRKAKEQNE